MSLRERLRPDVPLRKRLLPNLSPRKVLRIARWEVTKNADGVDRRTVAILAVTIGLVAVIGPLAAASGVALDAGIYRAGVDDTSPYYNVTAEDPTFAIADPDATFDRIDLRMDGGPPEPAPSAKGEAALAELRESVGAYNDRLMRNVVASGGNATAAFPVSVSLQYVGRNVSIAGDTGTDDTGGDGNGTGGGTGDGTTGATGGNGAGTGGGGTASDTGGGLGGAFGTIASSLTGTNGSTGTPSDISPPFPFQSLVLAFVFVLPLNFVIQAYGSTILSERLNRRGELMLVSPVSRGDIIAGKTLPYFLGAMAFEGVITGGIALLRGTGGPFSVAAVVPLVLLFLSAAFLGAMFARSFKELTFVTVAITVSLTSYAFVPAIFTDVTPIALISPLTIVVRDLAGQGITLTAFGFSTLPPLLTASLFFGLGAGLYREEDMFTQRSIPLKVLDALAGRISRPRSVAFVVAILIPFVLVAELVVVAMLFAIPQYASIPLLLGAIVVIEEVAKGVPVYAGFVHRRYDRSLRSSVLVGTMAGLGFFVAEKGLLAIQFLFRDQLPIEEQAAIATSGPVGDLGPVVAVLLLLAPLALHVVTATASAIGGSRGRRGFLAGLAVAVGIHFLYNLAVVSAFV